MANRKFWDSNRNPINYVFRSLEKWDKYPQKLVSKKCQIFSGLYGM